MSTCHCFTGLDKYCIYAGIDIQNIYCICRSICCICAISRVSPPTADCSAAQAAAVSRCGVQPSTSRICLTILYCTVLYCTVLCYMCTMYRTLTPLLDTLMLLLGCILANSGKISHPIFVYSPFKTIVYVCKDIY